MRHFGHIAPAVRKRLFHQEPGEFTHDSPARMLSAALGATLYSPATRPRLADDVVKQAGRGVVSMVLCLEDSINDADVAAGEENLVRQFADLAARPGADLPLLFIRVRFPEQIPDLARRLGPAVRLLSGFVLPKFTAERGLPFLEALATAGALDCFGHERRQAIWAAGAAAQVRADRLPGIVTGLSAPQLPGMDDWEEAVADLWATGVSPDGHPIRFLRADLDRRGAVTAQELRSVPDGARVLVGGVVTHRQRPATAAGVTFVNLEDETGLVNVVVSRGCWQRHRVVARSAPALLVSGRLERSPDDVVNVVATKLEQLPVVASLPSRDFR